MGQLHSCASSSAATEPDLFPLPGPSSLPAPASPLPASPSPSCAAEPVTAELPTHRSPASTVAVKVDLVPSLSSDVDSAASDPLTVLLSPPPIDSAALLRFDSNTSSLLIPAVSSFASTTELDPSPSTLSSTPPLFPVPPRGSLASRSPPAMHSRAPPSAEADPLDSLDDSLDALHIDDVDADADADTSDDASDDDPEPSPLLDPSPRSLHSPHLRPPPPHSDEAVVDVTDCLDSLDSILDSSDPPEPSPPFDVLITPSDEGHPSPHRLRMSIPASTPSLSPTISSSPTSQISLLTTDGSSGGTTPLTPQPDSRALHGRSSSLGAAVPTPHPPLLVMRRDGEPAPFLMVPELDSIPYMDPSQPPPSNSPPPTSPFLSPPSPHHRRYHHHHLSNSPPRRRRRGDQQPPSPPSSSPRRMSDAEAPSSGNSPGRKNSTIETSHVSTYFNEQGQKQINQYVVEGGELGRGASGEVKLVYSLEAQAYYAMKEVSKATAKTKRLRTKDQQDAWENLKREIAIMKKVDHPHVVQLIEVMDDPHKGP